MREFSCVKCNVTVTSADRKHHSSTSEHADNGGDPLVVDTDYELVTDSSVTTDAPAVEVTRGMGQTK